MVIIIIIIIINTIIIIIRPSTPWCEGMRKRAMTRSPGENAGFSEAMASGRRLALAVGPMRRGRPAKASLPRPAC